MTKKEFIWLGIRAIGLYWLLILLHDVLQLVWIAGYWVLLKIRGIDTGNYTLTWLSRLMNFPLPLLFAIYFLFFGALIYKLINHCVRSRPEDLSRPSGYCYCEIIVRFLGLSFIFVMVSFLIGPYLYSYLFTALMTSINQPNTTLLDGLATTFQCFFERPKILLFLALYLVLAIVFGWYFLKKGRFFINLLNRLWLGKSTQDLSRNPIDPV